MATLAYGEVERSLVFIDRAHAIELAAIWRAIGSASTWGELRAMMPEKRYAALFLAMTKDGEEIPSDDAGFTGYDIPGVADGDYPEWPAQEMLKWVPREILDCSFCQVKDSVFNGPFVILDPSRETEIVAAFKGAGFECEKDQALVSFAAGHGTIAMADRPIPDLLNALASTNDSVRSSATDALEQLGQAAVTALLQALHRPEPAVRRGAASVLGTIRPISPEIVTALIETLSDENEDVSQSAGYALGSIGPTARPAVPSLIRALRHRSLKVREGAGWALGHIGPAAAAAIPALTEALSDTRTKFRAAWALEMIARG